MTDKKTRHEWRFIRGTSDLFAYYGNGRQKIFRWFRWKMLGLVILLIGVFLFLPSNMVAPDVIVKIKDYSGAMAALVGVIWTVLEKREPVINRDGLLLVSM